MSSSRSNLLRVTLSFLGVALLFWGFAHSVTLWAAGPSGADEEIRSQDILKKQLDILKKQRLFGKGKYITRRYELLKERAERAFDRGKFEEASLVYYTIVENPEFSEIIDAKEMEFRLIQSLYHAREDYASLDYIRKVLERGGQNPHFLEIFRILVDTLNRVRDWDRIIDVMQALQKQQSSLPGAIREEANYLFGRMSFFQGDHAQAKVIFRSVSSNSRFHSRAIYHMGVISALEGDLPLAAKNFERAYDISKKSADFQISKSKQGDKVIAEDKSLFQDLCLLSLARVYYTMGKEGRFTKVAQRSPYYPVAVFENGWSAFRQKRYEDALTIARDFMKRFPENGLYPEALLLSGHSHMEAGRLDVAGQEFSHFVDLYEPLIPVLRYISQNKDPNQAFKDFNTQEQIKARPELYAWAFEGPNLENIRRALNTITKGEKGVESNREIWQSIGTLLGEGKKIHFPSKTRISEHPKLVKSRIGSTQKERRLQDLDRIETSLKQRIKSLEDGLKSTKLDKGRRQALEKAVSTERARLQQLQEKTAALKTKVLADRRPEKPLADSKDAVKDTGEASKEFGELIATETSVLPIIQKGLERKRTAFQFVSAKIVQKRLGALTDELTLWVRKAYLGEIEIAFIRREKTKGEEQQAARQQLVGLINAFLKKYPGAPEVPDQWFRLAELAYEESKQHFFAAQSVFDQQYEQYQKGTLKVEPKEPRADYSESINICRRILREFPTYNKKDRVLYVLGYYHDEQNQKEESLETFRQLVEEFPKSEFAPEGFMRLAENYFDLRKFKKAIETYAVILQHRESIFYEISLYKTAWAYYRLGEFKEAVNYFTKVVSLGKPNAAPITGTGLEAERLRRLQDLHNEAITYLALSFSEEGGPRGVIAHFEQAGLGTYTLEVLRRLSDIYYDTLRHQEAIEATRIYLEYSPYQADGPKYQARIVEAYEKMGETQAAFQERQRLANLFGPRSAWTEKNRNNPAAIKEARTLVEESLVYSATLFHEKAQKIAGEKEGEVPKEAQESYALALEAYKKYIWDFPDSPKAYEMRYNYAEALYAMKSYEEAGFQYDKVARSNLKDGKFLKDSAFNAILSYERLVKQSGIDFEAEVSKMKTPQVPDAGAAAKQIKKREFDRGERLLAQSYDNYVQWLPKGEKVPEVAFKAALLHYHVQDYPSAVQRFADFYDRFPNHRLAPSALNYILVAYTNTQNWAATEEWARKIMKDPSQAKNFERKDLEKLLAAAMMYQAENLRQGGKYSAASDKYMDINKEFKNNPLAARGLYNAAAIYEKAGKVDEAIATLEKLVETYPDSEFATKSLFHVAKSYEKQMKFDQAALAYERLARKYPDSENAADSLYNAGNFMESLGQYGRAADNYLEYARRYSSRPDASEVHFAAARAAELGGKPERAAQLYLEQAAKFNPPPDRELECLARAAENYEKMGQGEEANKLYSRTVNFYEKNSRKVTEKGRYFAGKARFLQAEEDYARFSEVKLRLPAKQMAKDLEDKAERLERANTVYSEVVAIGHPEWATAALYKIGKGYQDFSESLYTAPKPKGMTEQELEAYQRQLEEQAFPIEDKAVEAYEKGLQKAQELGAYGVWTQKLLTQLQTFRPKKYAPLNERLPEMRLKGSYHEGGFVEIQQ